jgi:uncharacterized protein DUF6968
MRGVGVDAIHALQLAQVAIHAQLTTCDEYKAGSLYWLDPTNKRDVGFPSSPRVATGAKRKSSSRRARRSV